MVSKKANLGAKAYTKREKKNRIKNDFASMGIMVLIMVATANLMIFLALNLASFDKTSYQKSFERHGIYDKFSYDKTIVDEEFSKVLVYTEGGEGLDSDYFNEKEREHLRDVRGIFRFIDGILFISFFLVVAGFIALPQYVKRGIYLGYCFIGILVVAMAISFKKAFLFMHILLFTNNLWRLDPLTDNLIRMMPTEIFVDVAIRWIVWCAVISLVFFGLLYIVERYSKNKEDFVKRLEELR